MAAIPYAESKILRLLARDIAMFPERLVEVDADFIQYLIGLTRDVETDLDVRLSPEDE